VLQSVWLWHNIVLQDHLLDMWWWILDPIIGYSVKATYHFLTAVNAHPDQGLFDDFWHKQAPLKVSLFSWRLLCNRLPTKENLVR